MSIIQGTGRGGARSLYDYPIEQSLRFNGTSSYLSRTPSVASNQKTWTWSGWVKLGVISSSMGWLFGANGQTAIYISDGTNPNFRVNGVGGGDTGTTLRLRDPSAWYSIVVSVDTTTTAADRLKIYINGVRVTDFDYNSDPTLDADTSVNSTNDHSIGSRFWAAGQEFNGYLANIQFIDGQALDASYFGETKDDIWIPKTFDGTSSTGGSTVSTDYGTNGFLLDFSSISGTTINDTAPIDTNHSSANNWTATGF